jgi:hypothetical protein
MDDDLPYSASTRTFILRIWREKRELPGKEALLRGKIEDIHSGKKRFVKNKEEILEFLDSQLLAIGL